MGSSAPTFRWSHSSKSSVDLLSHRRIFGFEWDHAKNERNLQKHGISFEEAATLLAGTAPTMEAFDESHSEDEARFVAIGPIARGVIVVSFAELDEKTVRIISARAATIGEKRRYEAWKVEALD